ncbi:hypothetical protein LQG66_11840 [Bradyrhizobium ontarionense]|uniref:Uncharacterized protein n=1 Tax=Bradyrhizobium ontarionense TaxID=2898149 RepID=A0ABY3RJY8_9BRAD|nr:hypothetical protein [Bradyrhizobium sp. A19]UFZ06944.1 hypothetical protein LQG66_11840 [Bradyrhizobium sp. A19]
MELAKTVAICLLVMPGLDPGIHGFLSTDCKDVDGRVKPGHDDLETASEMKRSSC